MYSNEGFPIWEGKIGQGYRKGFGKMYDLRGKLVCMGWFEGSHNCDKSKPYFKKDHVGKFVENMGSMVL